LDEGRGRNCKTAASARRGTNLDAMSKTGGGPRDDKKPQSEAFGGCRIKSSKGLEHTRQLVLPNAGTVVANLDANFCPTPTAPDHDAAAGCGVLERIAHEVAYDPVEHHLAADERGAAAEKPKIDAFISRRLGELSREPFEQRLELYRLFLDAAGLLLNPERIHESIEPVRQFPARSATTSYISSLPTGRQLISQQVERSDNHL
jgi:hypothetical protein